MSARKGLTLPRTPALYQHARLQMKPKHASALELVLRTLVRPPRTRAPWWYPAEHLAAAASEAEDLFVVAQAQAEKLAGLEGAEPLAAIASEAERELREIAHRLRVRLPTQYRLAGSPPGAVLRPTAAVRLPDLLNRHVIVQLAGTVARASPRQPRWRPKIDRQPLVALRKDVTVLAAHLAPGVTWPEEWGDLVPITDIAKAANDLAERIEDVVEPPRPRGRRTPRYVAASAGGREQSEGAPEEER